MRGSLLHPKVFLAVLVNRGRITPPQGEALAEAGATSRGVFDVLARFQQKLMQRFFLNGYATAFFAVLAAWLALSAPWLSGEVTIPYDAKAHFQAQIQFLANALHTGQSPFWTHNVFGGSPQIADPQSLIFSPAFLLAYFEAVPSFRQLDGMVFLYLGLAAIAVLMFFRDRGWHPAGAAVAAIALAFGASAAWRLQHIMQVQTLAFLAIASWLLARALARSSATYGLLAGLFIGFMVVGPGQVSMLGCYLLAGYVIHHWFSSRDRMKSFRQSLRPLVVCGVVSALLAGVPIILTYLFLESSNRPDVEFYEAGRGSLHPAFLLTAFVPDLFSFGMTDPKVEYWGPASRDWSAEWLSLSKNMGQIYIGALPIMAVVLLGLRRGVLFSREIRFFSVATAIMLIYALGRYTPIFEFMYDYVPGVAFFRRPADATFLFGGTFAILAGYLIHVNLTREIGPGTLLERVMQGIAMGAVLVASIAIAVYFGKLALAIKPLLVAAVLLLAATALLIYNRQLGRYSVHIPVVLLSGFMVLDLAQNNGPNESTGLPPAKYDVLLPNSPNTTIKFLRAKLQQPKSTARRDRVELVGLGFEWPNASLVHDFDNVFGYNPLRLADVNQGLGAMDTLAEARQRVFTPLFPSYRSMMADLLGLRYIASSVPLSAIDKHIQPGDLGLIARTPDAYIYENPRALPRALFVADWRDADFEALMKSGEWPEFNPKRTLLLENEPDLPRPTADDLLRASTSSVRIQTYQNTVVELDVDAKTAGFVLLNDVWHPWWYVTVDGKPADIVKANVLFRAVQVTKGKHLLRFEFRPFEGAIAELSNDIFEDKPIAPGR
jgi:hypothetical protein